MAHFFERPKKRAAKKVARRSALRRADALWRGTNRNSPAVRAQTTIRSFRAFASPPDSPDRARPGGTKRESMNAAPALESRAGTDVQVYQRTHLTNLTPLPPFYLTLSQPPDRARQVERLLRARSSLEEGHMPTPGRPTHIHPYTHTKLRTPPSTHLHAFRPSHLHTVVPGQAKNRR
jgi:hypothetical protein